MKIPNRIKIGGLCYKVIKKDRFKGGGISKVGSVVPFYQKIWIDSTASQGIQETTLLHETLEVINDINDLGIEHHKLCVLETFLYQVLKDNKLHF